MKISPVCISFQHDKNNLQGLREFSRLHRNEQEVLLNHEEIRQSFNELHPELNLERKLTPLEKYVEETVAHSRKLAKELKLFFKRGKTVK